MKYITRKEARELGLVRYFDGSSCKRNHKSERYTKSANCVECVGATRGKRINACDTSTNPNDALARKALAEGITTYIPIKPCRKGHNLRYSYSHNCVECSNESINRTRDNLKYGRMRRLYGLNKESYFELAKKFNYSCGLCFHKPDEVTKLHIDHCHDTNKVRGLLCGPCNQGIGLLKHNPELMRKAAIWCE